MKIGLFTWPFNDVPLEKVLKFASRLGCQAIEVATDTGRDYHLNLERVLKGGATEYKRLISSYNLEISALSCHIDSQLIGGPHGVETDRIFRGTPEEKIKYGVERVKKTIECAAALDVTVINGFLGCVNFSWLYPWPGGSELWEKAYEQIAERWSAILDYCGSHGVRFAHEPFPQQQAFSIETAKELLKAFGMRRELGFNLDPANLMWFLVDPVSFIEEFGERIYSVHAKDAEVVQENVRYSSILLLGSRDNPRRGFRFRVVGWGQIDWRRLITALIMVNYDGVLSIEHEDPWLDRVDGCIKAFNFLKSLVPEKVGLE
ncbi:MAG: sugar phosphate isomerase/epimerase [Nitrososphaerota archaeon]